jgi:hypothetical protein
MQSDVRCDRRVERVRARFKADGIGFGCAIELYATLGKGSY